MIGCHVKRIWFPEIKQFYVGPNPNYLNSLVTGIVTPLLNLPINLLNMVVLPLIQSISRLVVFMLVSVAAGILGRANGFEVITPDRKNSK